MLLARTRKLVALAPFLLAQSCIAGFMTAGSLYVDLTATDPSAGTALWANKGLLGDFTSVGSPSFVADVAGTGFGGVFFNGESDAYIGPTAVADISGSSDRSMEVWIYNPSVDSNEETILAMGRRGTGRGGATINHGNSAAFGAATHWADDGGWASLPAAGEWHHLVYTYDGATTFRLYVDGMLDSTNMLSGPLNTFTDTINLAVQRVFNDPTQLAFDNEFDGTQMSFSGYINSVRVHGGVLDDSAIMHNYGVGPAVAAAAVPEPSTFVAFGIGLVSFGAVRWRRRSATA